MRLPPLIAAEGGRTGQAWVFSATTMTLVPFPLSHRAMLSHIYSFQGSRALDHDPIHGCEIGEMLKPFPQHRNTGFAIPPARQEAPQAANPVDRLAQGGRRLQAGWAYNRWHSTGPAILRAPTPPCRACRARPDSAWWHRGCAKRSHYRPPDSAASARRFSSCRASSRHPLFSTLCKTSIPQRQAYQVTRSMASSGVCTAQVVSKNRPRQGSPPRPGGGPPRARTAQTARVGSFSARR